MTKRIIEYVSGILIICYAVACIINARIGVTAADAINTNVSYLTPLSIGQSIGIMSVTFVVISFLFNRKIWTFVSLIFAVILTPGIDFFYYQILEVHYPTELWFRILNFGIGVLLINFGSALTIHSRLPMTPYDQLTMTLVEVTKKPLIAIRLTMEALFLIIGAILGILSGHLFETVSIGTILFGLTGGPLIRFYLYLFRGGKKHVNQQAY